VIILLKPGRTLLYSFAASKQHADQRRVLKSRETPAVRYRRQRQYDTD
jgi:hypothetical protein